MQDELVAETFAAWLVDPLVRVPLVFCLSYRKLLRIMCVLKHLLNGVVC